MIKKNPKRNNWHHTSTLSIRTKMLNICKDRLCNDPDDQWALEVQSKNFHCIDFVAAEARHHHNCQLKFRMGKDYNKEETAAKQQGRSKNLTMMELFYKACDWLESEYSTHTLREFHTKLTDIAAAYDDVYDIKYLNKLLIRHYGDHIFFTECPGRETVICFKYMADYIVNHKHKEKRRRIV